MTFSWSEKGVSDHTDELAVCLDLLRSENISKRWGGGGGGEKETRNRERCLFCFQFEKSRFTAPPREKKEEKVLLLVPTWEQQWSEAFKPPVQLFSFDANKESANINVMCELWESVIKQFRHNWKLQFTGCSKVDWWNTDTLFQDVLHKKQLRLARNPKSQFWAYLTFTKCWINKLIWIILQQNDAFYCLICPRGFSLDFLDLNPK